MNNHSRSNPIDFESFIAEIQEVQSTLLAATTDLTNPLGDLVRAQIKRSQPPVCGATVLAVAMSPSAISENGDLRRKRILLAAALEMLHIALNVHRLLVNAALQHQKAGNEDELDRSFIGSTILAGDYCFSRAAQMAAQTDNPRVVATFSLALQAVSEGLLREQFQPSDGNSDSSNTSGGGNDSYDETRQLLQSGAHAAALLVDLPETEQQKAIALSQELATHWKAQPTQLPANNLPANWQALYHWLNRQRVPS